MNNLYMWLFPLFIAITAAMLFLHKAIYNTKKMREEGHRYRSSDWYIPFYVIVAVSVIYVLVSLSTPYNVYEEIPQTQYTYTKFQNRVFVVFNSGKVIILSTACAFNKIDNSKLILRKGNNVWGCSISSFYCVEDCCEFQNISLQTY